MDKLTGDHNDLKNGDSKKSNKYNYLIILLILSLILFGIYRNRINTSEQTIDTPSQNVNVVTDTSPEITPNYGPVPGQVLVKFKQGITDTVISERLKPLNVQIKGKIDGINVTILEVTEGQEESILETLSKDPAVQYAERNYYAHATMIPNDVDFNKQWGILNAGGSVIDPKTNKGHQGTANADIHLPNAWDVSKGTGIKVAVIDTGIDMTHPDLSGKIAGNKDFVSLGIDDGFGHGTHVAGILAANTDNSEGIAGVCPDCQLYIAKVLDNNGSGDMATIAQGVTWAADQGVNIINISAGGPVNIQSLTQAVNYARNKNILLVGAAGNDGSTNQFYPAAIDGVMGVGATDNSDIKLSFSNYGQWVQIAAPGFAIYSTLPHLRDSNLKNNYPGLPRTYGSLNGSSMSAPFVSGVAALVFKTQYGTSADAVKKRLCDTADKTPGTGSSWVCGRVNAEAAVGVSPASPTSQPTTPQPTTPQPTTPQPTTPQATATPSVTETPATAVPTFVCGGSGIGEVCPPTITPKSSATNPTSNPTNSNTPTTTTGQTTAIPTNPLNSGGNQINNQGKKKINKYNKRNKSGKENTTNNGLIALLMGLITTLLDLLMKLLKPS